MCHLQFGEFVGFVAGIFGVDQLCQQEVSELGPLRERERERNWEGWNYIGGRRQRGMDTAAAHGAWSRRSTSYGFKSPSASRLDHIPIARGIYLTANSPNIELSICMLVSAPLLFFSPS